MIILKRSSISMVGSWLLCMYMYMFAWRKLSPVALWCLLTTKRTMSIVAILLNLGFPRRPMELAALAKNLRPQNSRPKAVYLHCQKHVYSVIPRFPPTYITEKNVCWKLKLEQIWTGWQLIIYRFLPLCTHVVIFSENLVVFLCTNDQLIMELLCLWYTKV